MDYIGDFVEDATVNIYFTTNDSSGGAVAPSTAFEAADVIIYKNNSATQKTSTNGITMTSPFDTITGLHLVSIDTSNDTGDAGFWVTGADYTAILSPDETVDSQTIVHIIGHFSIENKYERGTDSAALASALTTAQNDLDTITGAAGALLDTTATSAQLVDDVWDELLIAGEHNIATSAGRRLRNIQDFGIYDMASVWVDEVAGTSTGTTDGEDATVTNRANDFDNAQTIAASVGLDRINVQNGNTITLSATLNGYNVYGGQWTLALGGQDIGSSTFSNATISGIGTGTTPRLIDCTLGTVTLSPSKLYGCDLNGTFTVGSAGDYLFSDCKSSVAGAGAPTVDLGAAVGATTISFRRWSGGLTLNNVQAGDVVSVDVVSGGTITVNGTGGTVVVRGLCNVTDGSGGSVTITETSVVNMTKINTEADTAISDAALATAANLATAQADLDTLTGSDGVTLASAQPNTVAFAAGVTIDNPSGDGLAITSSGGNGDGLSAAGNGTGHGLAATGGIVGNGLHALGGATAGVGVVATTPSIGYGLSVTGAGGIANINGMDFDEIAGDISADQVNTDVVDKILTTAMTEDYAADGAAPTMAQALFAIQQFLQEKDITTTTMTVKKLDGSTTAMTFTLNDASDPTSITRAT